MRNFLKNLNIVQAMLAFREGNIIKISLNYYLNIADKIVILLDNYDKETEKIVLGYKKKYSDRIIVGYSTVPVVLDRKMPSKYTLNKRFKLKEGEIREELLQLVHRENKKKKIDILLWGDADEIFTSEFPQVLEKFWTGKKSALLCNHIQMIGDFNHFHNRRFYSHCKAFKYREDISSIPMRAQCLLNPFKKYIDTGRGGFVVVHMADFNKDFINKRSNYKFRPFSNNDFVWFSKKDIRDLSSLEYMQIIANKKPICSVNEYLINNM